MLLGGKIVGDFLTAALRLILLARLHLYGNRATSGEEEDDEVSHVFHLPTARAVIVVAAWFVGTQGAEKKPPDTALRVVVTLLT